jgi:hypothetical protein
MAGTCKSAESKSSSPAFAGEIAGISLALKKSDHFTKQLSTLAGNAVLMNYPGSTK